MRKIFGTDGIRGEINKGFMTPANIVKLGKAIAQYFKNQNNKQKHQIIIGKDTRISGYIVEIDIQENLDEKKKKKKKRKKAGSESSKESSLRDWFGRKGAKGKKGGWVDCNTCRKDKKSGRTKCKACGREKGEKRSKYPACRPTPSACKERGRGKSWGKKTAKGKKG